jgi:hypothetical protein
MSSTAACSTPSHAPPHPTRFHEAAPDQSARLIRESLEAVLSQATSEKRLGWNMSIAVGFVVKATEGTPQSSLLKCPKVGEVQTTSE